MPNKSMVYIKAITLGRTDFGSQIGCERKSRGLRGLHAGAHQQERKGRSKLADPNRSMRVARQNQQGERHDRKAAKLQQRSHPDIGNTPPAQSRLMIVGSKADHRAEGCENQRQPHHQRHQARLVRPVRR